MKCIRCASVVIAWTFATVAMADDSKVGDLARAAADSVERGSECSARAQDVKPLPLVAIPDNPPPHEGALFELPYVVNPPDLLSIEVLEALPGRPITGEFLVQPNGKINLGYYGELHVSGLTVEQVKTKVVLHLKSFLAEAVLGLAREGGESVAPKASDRVAVRITGYNSAVYYVLGDVNRTSRLPRTGSETVLDAIEISGGLAPTADPKKIRLVRPARGNNPIKTYSIDLQAIRDGDSKANLQLFPGDRVIVEPRAETKAPR